MRRKYNEFLIKLYPIWVCYHKETVFLHFGAYCFAFGYFFSKKLTYLSVIV